MVGALQSGFKVRAVVRRVEQAEAFRKKPVLQPYLEALEISHVPDLTTPGALDDAMQKVDFVIHCASPMVVAVSGVINILRVIAYHT